MKVYSIYKVTNNVNGKTYIGFTKKKVTCPHCEKVGGAGNMKRYHFDNCKLKG